MHPPKQDKAQGHSPSGMLANNALGNFINKVSCDLRSNLNGVKGRESANFQPRHTVLNPKPSGRNSDPGHGRGKRDSDMDIEFEPVSPNQDDLHFTPLFAHKNKNDHGIHLAKHDNEYDGAHGEHGTTDKSGGQSNKKEHKKKVPKDAAETSPNNGHTDGPTQVEIGQQHEAVATVNNRASQVGSFGVKSAISRQFGSTASMGAFLPNSESNMSALLGDPEDEASVTKPVLVLFVIVISMFIGMVALGIHYAVVYGGTAAAVNGGKRYPQYYYILNFFCDYEIADSYSDFHYLDPIGTCEAKGTCGEGYFKNEGLGIPIPVFFACYMYFGSFLCICIYHFVWKRSAYTYKELQGGGVSQAKVLLEQGLHSTVFVGVGRIMLSFAYTATGHPHGVEGPTIHIAVCLATQIAHWMMIEDGEIMSIIAFIGAVAGVAGAFNCPIAGITFALEEFMDTIPTNILSVFSIGSVASTMSVRYILGADFLFDMSHSPDVRSINRSAKSNDMSEVMKTQSGYVLTEALTVGLACGFVYAYTVRMYLALRMFFKRFTLYPRMLMISGVAATCGAISFSFTNQISVYGIGNESIKDTMIHDVTAGVFILLFFCKQIAVTVCGSMGAPGGMLSPALVTGGLLGGFIGHMLVAAFGEEHFKVDRCVIFGMAGGFAGMFRTPVTAIILIYELTGIYSLVLATMVCNFVASWTATKLQPESLYEGMIHQDHQGYQRRPSNLGRRSTFSASKSSSSLMLAPSVPGGNMGPRESVLYGLIFYKHKYFFQKLKQS